MGDVGQMINQPDWPSIFLRSLNCSSGCPKPQSSLQASRFVRRRDWRQQPDQHQEMMSLFRHLPSSPLWLRRCESRESATVHLRMGGSNQSQSREMLKFFVHHVFRIANHFHQFHLKITRDLNALSHLHSLILPSNQSQFLEVWTLFVHHVFLIVIHFHQFRLNMTRD
jgi:hypothetical protein